MFYAIYNTHGYILPLMIIKYNFQNIVLDVYTTSRSVKLIKSSATSTTIENRKKKTE